MNDQAHLAFVLLIIVVIISLLIFRSFIIVEEVVRAPRRLQLPLAIVPVADH